MSFWLDQLNHLISWKRAKTIHLKKKKSSPTIAFGFRNISGYTMSTMRSLIAKLIDWCGISVGTIIYFQVIFNVIGQAVVQACIDGINSDTIFFRPLTFMGGRGSSRFVFDNRFNKKRNCLVRPVPNTSIIYPHRLTAILRGNRTDPTNRETLHKKGVLPGSPRYKTIRRIDCSRSMRYRIEKDVIRQ